MITFKELSEAHKVGDKVTIKHGPKDVKGKTGRIGEIRKGLYKGAPKTFTVDYDHNEKTGQAKSVQLKSKHIQGVKEQVENLQEKHRVAITLSDPHHPAVTKRKELIQKTVRVKADNPGHAVDSAIHHFRRAGYKVHDHHYIGTVKEDTMPSFKDLDESALEAFRKAAAEREKKHDEIEAKRKEDAAKGKENMSGAIDRLDKQLNKEDTDLEEGTFKYHMDKAVAAHDRGDEKKKAYHLDNAKQARYSIKTSDYSKHKELFAKYKSMTEGLGRGREDDEYHTPDPVKHTYKFTVSKDGGEKHDRTVTTGLTTKSKHELHSTARAHLEKQGYKIHESVEESIQESAPFKKLDHAVAYATDKVKTHRDNLDGIEVYKHKSGGYDVNHTSNANGRNAIKSAGAKHLGTVYKDKPTNIKEDLDEARGAADKHWDIAHDHKEKASLATKGSEKYHSHMADYHDSMHRYHSDIGQTSHASAHADKAEIHHEKAYEASRSVKEATDLRAQLQKHSDAAIAANKAGDDEKVKHHMNKMNAIKDKMAKAVTEEAPVNNVGGGNIAGTQGDAGKKAVMTKKPLKRLNFKEFTEELEEGKTGLWANIHAKRKRIKNGSGERMRKPGSKGAPTAQDFKDAQEDVEVQFDMIEDFIEQLASLNGVDSEKIWEDLESVEDDELLEYAIDKKGHKSSEGGLTQKGVDAYNRKTGGNLQTAVTTKPSKLKPGSKAANRRKSFCARMGGMKKRLTSAKTANDPDSRINKALRKWNC